MVAKPKATKLKRTINMCKGILQAVSTILEDDLAVTQDQFVSGLIFAGPVEKLRRFFEAFVHRF